MAIKEKDLEKLIDSIASQAQQLTGLVDGLKNLVSAVQALTQTLQASEPDVVVGEKNSSLAVLPAHEVVEPAQVTRTVPTAADTVDEQLSFFQEEFSKLSKSSLVQIAQELELKHAKSIRKPDLISQILAQDSVKIEESLTALLNTQATEGSVGEDRIDRIDEDRDWNVDLFRQWPKNALIELGQQLGLTHLFRISKDELVTKVLSKSDSDIDLAFTTHWSEVEKSDSVVKDSEIWTKDDFKELKTAEIKGIAENLGIETGRKRRDRLITLTLEKDSQEIIDAWLKLWPRVGGEPSKATKPVVQKRSNTKKVPESQIDFDSLSRTELVNLGKELNLKTGRLTKKELEKGILACSKDDITNAFLKLWPEIESELPKGGQPKKASKPRLKKPKAEDFADFNLNQLKEITRLLDVRPSARRRDAYLDVIISCDSADVEKAKKKAQQTARKSERAATPKTASVPKWKKEDFSKYSRTDLSTIGTSLGLIIGKKNKTNLITEILNQPGKEIANAIKQANLGH